MSKERCEFCSNEIWLLRKAHIPVIKSQIGDYYICKNCAKELKGKVEKK